MDEVSALMSAAERRKPGFVKGANTDGLIAAVLRLAMEVCVLRERLDVHEALAERHGVGGEKAAEEFVPDAELTRKRAHRRQRLVELLVRDLTAVQ